MSNGRDRDRDVYKGAVFSAAYGVEMVHSFAGVNPIKDLLFFVIAVRRNDDGDRFVDHLVGAKTEKLFGASVPAGDDSIQIFADDRVVR